MHFDNKPIREKLRTEHRRLCIIHNYDYDNDTVTRNPIGNIMFTALTNSIFDDLFILPNE
jgi:hypothetical protein